MYAGRSESSLVTCEMFVAFVIQKTNRKEDLVDVSVSP